QSVQLGSVRSARVEHRQRGVRPADQAGRRSAGDAVRRARRVLTTTGLTAKLRPPLNVDSERFLERRPDLCGRSSSYAVAARWIEKQQPLRGQADPHSLPRPDRTVAGDPGDEALAATSTRHGVGFRLWTFGSGAVLELRSVGMIRASTVIATRGREPKAVSQE